jgi:putative ABC transport system permease protein
MPWHNRLFNLFRRERLSKEVAKELDFHVAERTDDLVAAGLPPRDAARQARRQFGAYALHKEDTWTADLAAWLETLAADLRYALRGFAKSPGFTAVAILSLALGIGANTAIFTLIDALMLRSLPVSHPEELGIMAAGTGRMATDFTNPMWEEIRRQQDVFSGVFAWGSDRFNIAPSGEVRYVTANWVSGGFFSTLGVRPAAGRILTESDDVHGCAATAVISHDYWTSAYGGDPSAVGRTIPLAGHPFRIVGVSQPGFSGVDVGTAAQVFVPICSEPVLHAHSTLDSRDSWWLSIMGRYKPGFRAAQANARLAVLAPGVMRATLPGDWRDDDQKDYLARSLWMQPGAAGAGSYLRRLYRPALLALMAAVGLVLLIACANVANLLLARATTRQREMAVRLALGAGRGRLIRQTLTESLLLSLIGAGSGLLLAGWASRLLTAMISPDSVALDLTPDTRVLLFTAGVGTATGILFGLLPALRSATVPPNAAMKAQGRGITEGHSRIHLGKVLVVAQIALSMVLVAGAGLMLATFRNLATMNPGFQAEGVMLVSVDPGYGRTPLVSRAAMLSEVLPRLRALPGVRGVSVSVMTPVSGSMWGHTNLYVQGQTPVRGDDSQIYLNAVSDGYFGTMSTPLVAGRDFDARDSKGAPRVAIVTESMARKFFDKSSAIGGIIQLPDGRGLGPQLQIVGIVGDAKYRELREGIVPTVYLPMAQSDEPGSTFEVRAAGSPAVLIASVKEAIASVSPHSVMEFTPLSRQLADSLTRERMLATLSGFFGGLALLLAAIGLYGVLAYNVARRRSEIGIRMALGAAQARVLRMVLGEAGWLAVAGLTLGVAGTLAASSVVKTLLFGLQANDPRIVAAAAATLAAVAGVAAYLPARRAARVDPMTALRDE